MKTRKKPLGTKNIIGKKVYELRIKNNLHQWELLAKLQLNGLNTIDESALSNIEGQHRRVQDYEVFAIAKAFGITTDELMSYDINDDKCPNFSLIR